MPTYSYRCTECGEAFDIQQAFTDDTLTICPNCGGKLRKLFSAVGVSFTGSGFYRNDSRAPAAAKGGSSAGESGSGGSGSGSGESGSGSSGSGSSDSGSSAPAPKKESSSAAAPSTGSSPSPSSSKKEKP